MRLLVVPCSKRSACSDLGSYGIDCELNWRYGLKMDVQTSCSGATNNYGTESDLTFDIERDGKKQQKGMATSITANTGQAHHS